jgi:hypothetical protein
MYSFDVNNKRMKFSLRPAATSQEPRQPLETIDWRIAGLITLSNHVPDVPSVDHVVVVDDVVVLDDDVVVADANGVERMYVLLLCLPYLSPNTYKHSQITDSPGVQCIQ